MSSHREAPEISKDPVADSTDVYAFVSPDRPDAVTLIANYIPLQGPAGGPNFYEFGEGVLYENPNHKNGDGPPATPSQFRFNTTGGDPPRTTPAWPPRRGGTWAGSRCSPGSAPRPSTLTWARSSTWVTCGRS